MYRRSRLILSGVLLALASQADPAAAQLCGHGGPVRALTISGDGETALSGSFDSSAILWYLPHDSARQVLRFHDSAVNAVALLKDSRIATAGEDMRIALWITGNSAPDRVLEGHTGPVVGLAVSPDGGRLASASWDGTIRLWALAEGEPIVLEGHRQNVNGVAFTPDGQAVVSASYDATVRIWPLREPTAPVVVPLPTPLNAVAVAPDGEIAAAGADGQVYLVSPAGNRLGAVEAVPTPVIALSISGDGAHLAAASIRGAVAIIDRPARRLVRTLVGPAFPVWSLAFFPDNRTLLTGGADGVIRRWDSASGAEIGAPAAAGATDPLAAYEDDQGARLFRACAACHTLTGAESNRAGPSLHGIFGRRIASLPGYNYSEPLRHLDIVWTSETLAKLFEIGPARYTPGTKMPEQQIGSPEDRAALIKFLERATR
jgi:cytochrome c